MQSTITIANWNKSFRIESDECGPYIGIRFYELKRVLGNLVSTTKIREHYDAEGVLRYVDYIIYLKG